MSMKKEIIPNTKQQNVESILLQLKCEKNDGRLNCNVLNPSELEKLQSSESKNEDEILENVVNADIYGSLKSTDNLNKKKEGISTISISILFSLLSGIGFATAYFFLYILYDYSTQPDWVFNNKMLFSFIILLSLLIVFTVVVYILLKKPSKQKQK